MRRSEVLILFLFSVLIGAEFLTTFALFIFLFLADMVAEEFLGALSVVGVLDSVWLVCFWVSVSRMYR